MYTHASIIADAKPSRCYHPIFQSTSVFQTVDNAFIFLSSNIIIKSPLCWKWSSSIIFLKADWPRFMWANEMFGSDSCISPSLSDFGPIIKPGWEMVWWENKNLEAGMLVISYSCSLLEMSGVLPKETGGIDCLHNCTFFKYFLIGLSNANSCTKRTQHRAIRPWFSSAM